MKRRPLPEVDLSTTIGSVTLPSPVMTAAGTAGHGAELHAFFPLDEIGAVVVKSLAPWPWDGNAPLRVHATGGGGMINSVGLQGPGLPVWLETELPELERTGTYDFRSGAAEAEALLDLADPPTAIFASSDDMAAGALVTAHRRGLQLPDQLSIAGFDDTALASVVWPALTTIRQPIRDMAQQAADLLLADGAGENARRTIAHALVVRDSTAKPSR